MDVVLRILPFFLFVGVGAAAARAGVLGEAAAAGLSRYVFWIAFPALLVHALATQPPPGPDDLRGLIAYGAAMTLPYLAAAALARVRRWPEQARAALPLMAGAQNDAFLAAPLAASVFGAAVGRHAPAMVALNWVVLVPCGLAVLHRGARGGSLGSAVTGALLNPVTITALAGAACMVAGLRAWPAPIETVLAGLGASSTPVALTALGAVVALEGVRPAPGEVAPVLGAVALRLLLAPAAVWVATGWAGASAEFRTCAVLLAAAPTAVTVFIQAKGYAIFGRGAAQGVVISTLASAVTLTLLALALARA